MKTYEYAAIAASLLSSTYAQFPSCASSCVNAAMSGSSSLNQLCSDSSMLSTARSCIASSACSDSDKNSIYSYLDSTCGSSSGGVNSISTGGINGFNGVSLTNSAAFASYTSAHPNGPSSGDWASFTSANGISSGPWGTGVPTGWSTQYGSGGQGGFGGGGGPGGQHGPFGFGGGPGGWGPNSGGPFQGGNWGNGPFGQSGAWTTGAWTKWWNGNQCPASDWPGWTSGSWSTSAPWTSWSACTASVTSSSIYTTTSFGSNVPYTTTSFGYMVAQATAAGQSAALTTGSSGATSITVAGGAAAAALMGFIAML